MIPCANFGGIYGPIPCARAFEAWRFRVRRMHISGLEQLRSESLLGPRWNLRFLS
jgi:hypothetical protein